MAASTTIDGGAGSKKRGRTSASVDSHPVSEHEPIMEERDNNSKNENKSAPHPPKKYKIGSVARLASHGPWVTQDRIQSGGREYTVPINPVNQISKTIPSVKTRWARLMPNLRSGPEPAAVLTPTPQLTPVSEILKMPVLYKRNMKAGKTGIITDKKTVNGRDYTYTHHVFTIKNIDRFHIPTRHKLTHNLPFIPGGRAKWSWMARIPADRFTKEEADQLKPFYEKLLASWPWPAPPTTQIQRDVIRMILQRTALPNVPEAYGKFIWYDHSGYELTIDYLDPLTGLGTTGGVAKRRIRLDPRGKLIDPNLEIPDPCRPCTFGDLASPEDTLTENMGDSEKKRHRVAIRAMKHFAAEVSGTYMTNQDLTTAWRAHMVKLGLGKRMVTRGIYGGHPIFTTRLESALHELRIVPSIVVSRNVTGGVLTSISLPWIRKSLLIPILERINSTWLERKNIIEAWDAGIQLADIMIEMVKDGDALPRHDCSCKDWEHSQVLHFCDKCLGEYECKTMVTSQLGQLCCRSCEEALQPGQDVLLRLAKDLFLDSLRSEKKKHGPIMKHTEADYAAGAQALEAIFAEFPKHEPGFMDAYTQQFVPMENWGKSRIRRPLHMSIDAIFPFGLRSLTHLLHAKDNIAVTTRVLNFLKWTFIPGCLQILADYLKCSRSLDERVRFMKDMDKAFAVGACNRYKREQRGQRSRYSVHENLLMWLTAELPAGITIDDMMIQQDYIFGERIDMPEADWKPNNVDDVIRIIGEIEQKHNIIFRRGLDGCPFPFEGVIPDDWSWWTMFHCFTQRAHRMFVICNRHWAMVDTATTIFLQACLTYADRSLSERVFDLPMTVWIRHPLRFSVGHYHHGMQLRSGWKSGFPSSLAEWDKSLNNMQIEAWMANMGKLDFLETDYGLLRRYAESVNLPSKYWDPTATMPKVENILGAKNSAVGIDIDADFPEPADDEFDQDLQARMGRDIDSSEEIVDDQDDLESNADQKGKEIANSTDGAGTSLLGSDSSGNASEPYDSYNFKNDPAYQKNLATLEPMLELGIPASWALLFWKTYNLDTNQASNAYMEAVHKLKIPADWDPQKFFKLMEREGVRPELATLYNQDLGGDSHMAFILYQTALNAVADGSSAIDNLPIGPIDGNTDVQMKYSDPAYSLPDVKVDTHCDAKQEDDIDAEGRIKSMQGVGIPRADAIRLLKKYHFSIERATSAFFVERDAEQSTVQEESDISHVTVLTDMGCPPEVAARIIQEHGYNLVVCVRAWCQLRDRPHTSDDA